MKQDQYPDIPNLHWQGNVRVKISYIRFLRNEIKTDQKEKKNTSHEPSQPPRFTKIRLANL